MAKEELKLTKPRIIISEDATEEARKRIVELDSEIHERPEAFFITVAEMIGKLAAGQTIDFGKHDDNVTYMNQHEADLIGLYIDKRDDRVIEFDRATEASINNDPDYKINLDKSLSLTAVTYKTGVMKSEKRPSLDAEPARDLARLSLINHFIGRVATYQYQHQPFTPEASSVLQPVEVNLPTTDLAGA